MTSVLSNLQPFIRSHIENLINVYIYLTFSYNGIDVLCYTQTKEKEEEFTKSLKLTSRERHFINFASVEYDGQIYMTPQDFLESFVEEEPRRKCAPKFTLHLLS